MSLSSVLSGAFALSPRAIVHRERLVLAKARCVHPIQQVDPSSLRRLWSDIPWRKRRCSI